MTQLLRWQEARRSHRDALSTFTCTEDPVKSLATRWKPEHPRPWECDVQGWIRSLEPSRNGPRSIRVGEDARGLAAASCYEEVDGPTQVDLLVMAIALRLRRRGGGYADEMMDDTLDAITGRAIATETPEVLVTARAWEENAPSQAMCRRAGLRHTGMAAPRVQQWSIRLLM